MDTSYTITSRSRSGSITSSGSTGDSIALSGRSGGGVSGRNSVVSGVSGLGRQTGESQRQIGVTNINIPGASVEQLGEAGQVGQEVPATPERCDERCDERSERSDIFREQELISTLGYPREDSVSPGRRGMAG